MAAALIYDHLRTPRGRGRTDGALHTIAPVALAAQVLSGIARRNKLPEDAVDDVLMGCVAPVGEQGADIARSAALLAGLGQGTAGVQINRFCGSGLEAVRMAAAQVVAGHADLCIAGGVESMSRVPMGSDGGAWYTDPLVAWATGFVPQGISADLLATLHGHSRDRLDALAAQSHQRAAAAWARGAFDASVLPVLDTLGRTLLARDEAIRAQTTVQSLAALRPSFAELGHSVGFDAVALERYPHLGAIAHLHHAGNSSAIVDGAAGLLIGSEEAGRRWGLRPRARVVTAVAVGSEPTLMLSGPVPAARKALQRAGLRAADIDLWEVNEAFASVVLCFLDEMAVDPALVNANGGAIALGHPLGATGAMILGTLLDELEARGKRYGLATLCVAAGMGSAAIIERL
jgi:acetyl-CoA C-acetyltransferase